MHLALDRDVRVRDGGGKELAESAEKEGNRRRHLALLLDRILHLLKEGILEDGVDDQDEGRHHTGEQGLGPLVLEEGHEGPDGARGPGRLGAGLEVTGLRLLARGDAGVDDPDGVRHEDGRGAGEGTGEHGLDRGELLVGAAGRDGALLEEGLGPLIPVVVDEVGDADAEERRVDARVQARGTFPGNDLLDGIDELALGFPGLDLGTC